MICRTFGPREHACPHPLAGTPGGSRAHRPRGGRDRAPGSAEHGRLFWAQAWSIVERHPELVPMRSRGTNAVLAATDGTVHWWSAHVCAYPRGPSPRLGHRTRVCREYGRRHLRAAVHRTGADSETGGRAASRNGRHKADRPIVRSCGIAPPQQADIRTTTRLLRRGAFAAPGHDRGAHRHDDQHRRGGRHRRKSTGLLQPYDPATVSSVPIRVSRHVHRFHRRHESQICHGLPR